MSGAGVIICAILHVFSPVVILTTCAILSVEDCTSGATLRDRLGACQSLLMYRGSIPQSCFWKDIGCLLRCVPHPHAASIPVVGFNAVLTSEHFGAFFTFAVLHAALAIRYIKVFAAWQSSPALGQNLDVMRLQAIKLFSTSGSQDVGHCKTTHEVVRCSQCLRPALGTAATL